MLIAFARFAGATELPCKERQWVVPVDIWIYVSQKANVTNPIVSTLVIFSGNIR